MLTERAGAGGVDSLFVNQRRAAASIEAVVHVRAAWVLKLTVLPQVLGPAPEMNDERVLSEIYKFIEISKCFFISLHEICMYVRSVTNMIHLQIHA